MVRHKAKSHFDRAQQFLTDMDTEGVIIECAQSLDRAPGDIQALKMLGLAFTLQGRYSLASNAYAAILRLNPQDAEAHASQGACMEKLGSYAIAISHYRDSVELDPRQPVAHLELGRLLANFSDYERALEHLRTAVRLQPSLLPAHYHLGLVLNALGYRTEARTQWKQVARADRTGKLGAGARLMLQRYRAPVSRFEILLAEAAIGVFRVREKIAPRELVGTR